MSINFEWLKCALDIYDTVIDYTKNVIHKNIYLEHNGQNSHFFYNSVQLTSNYYLCA